MKTVTLDGKEYQLDIEQAKKLNLLKEKDTKVKSWEEFKKKYIKDTGYVYSEKLNTSMLTKVPFYINDQLTPHEAKALAAFSKLLKLRRDWIREWDPNLLVDDEKFAICRRRKHIMVFSELVSENSLSFPTERMAREFLYAFRSLIEGAKMLI